MKITEKILSIPPYISTSWENVRSLQVDSQSDTSILVITLYDNKTVYVRGLNTTLIEAIFAMHAKVIQQVQEKPRTLSELGDIDFLKGNLNPELPDLPIRFGIATDEGMSPITRHNPAQADAPNLPPEILNKVAAVAKILGIDGQASLSLTEADCNCFHCQITRAIQKGIEISESGSDIEESVTEEDLRFCNWDIHVIGDALYEVINRTDKEDSYTVFLGESISCTCGSKTCEHIRAVLESDI